MPEHVNVSEHCCTSVSSTCPVTLTREVGASDKTPLLIYPHLRRTIMTWQKLLAGQPVILFTALALNINVQRRAVLREGGYFSSTSQKHER